MYGTKRFPIYQCPPATKAAWVARVPKDIELLKRAGAVQTSSIPFGSRSSQILTSDGRYPGYKCISAAPSYIPGEDMNNSRAINDAKHGTYGPETEGYTGGESALENRVLDAYGVVDM